MTGPVVIANGRLLRGRSAVQWQDAVAQLRSSFGRALEIQYTAGPGDAVRLARNALAEGARWLIAAGGDGTAHEAANGFFETDSGAPSPADLSLLPFGSGNDWARTLGIPLDARTAVQLLTRSRPRRVDLGHARFRGPDGATEERLFLNMAEAGVGAATLARLAQRAGAVGRGGYLFHAVVQKIRYKPVRIRLEVDGKRLELPGPVLNLMAAGGRFFGGGLECAPMARPDDGKLEAIVIGDVGFLDLLGNLRRFARGTYLGHPKVVHRSVRRLKAWSESAVPFELDGEFVGSLPVEMEVLPRALSVRC